MKPAKDQKDQNLDFNGQAGDGVNRAGNRFSGNHSGLTAKEQYGRGPTKGNMDREGREVKEGKSVTRDPARRAPATAAQGGKINGGATAKCPSNADKIYVGK
jgi:hypothetical protein